MRFPGVTGHSEVMTLRLLLKNLAWSDLGVVVWICFCAALGLAIGDQVRQLDRFGTTIDQSARALDEVAAALEQLAGVPFVGDGIRDVADEIAATAQVMRQSASDTRSAAANLSVLLTLAVMVIPTAPVLALYVPYRVQQVRQNTNLLRSLRGNRGTAFTRNYLANRALSDLTYNTLRRIGPDPWGQVREGHVEELAAEELRQLGLGDEVGSLTERAKEDGH